MPLNFKLSHYPGFQDLEQAKLEEVFLPYLILPGDKTLFETMARNQFLLPKAS
jgi:hypothetical protein